MNGAHLQLDEPSGRLAEAHAALNRAAIALDAEDTPPEGVAFWLEEALDAAAEGR